MKRQLPGHHFLLTFTVPEILRRFIRKNQRVAYSALFKASSEAMKKLALDEHYVGGDLPGFFGILHILRLRSGQALGTDPRVSLPYPLRRPRRRPLYQGFCLRIPMSLSKNRRLKSGTPSSPTVRPTIKLRGAAAFCRVPLQ